MKLIRILPIILLLSDACVDPYNLPDIANEPALVVDGLITNLTGTHTVKLYLTSSLEGEDVQHPVMVTGATVTVRNDLGETEELLEAAPGNYNTSSDFVGEIGRIYQLSIVTADGKEYESDPATMTPPGEIERIYFEFKANSINKDDPYKPQDAVYVYLDAKGENGAPNLLRWRWTGTYHVRTYPEWRTRADPITMAKLADPLPCSGYVAGGGRKIIYLFPCECCDCWVTQHNRNALVSNNEYVEQAMFNRVFMTMIPVDRRIFHEKYHIQVEQLSVPEEVYDFWSLIKAQEQAASDIFQPAIVKVKGNVHSKSDPDEPVFGIFSVSATTTQSLFIKREDIPTYIPLTDSLFSDCRNAYPGSTNKEPFFW